MILHIISGDKFTVSYIRFMIKKMGGVKKHCFIVYKPNAIFMAEDIDINGLDYSVVKKNSELFSRKNIEKMKNADKIIVSGIFGGVEKALVLLWKGIAKQIYLQFWGGDFYSYRNVNFFSKAWLRKKILHRCIKRCAGVINLVPGDYDELSKIFPNDRPHYVASMPSDPTKKRDYSKYFDWPNNHRIILGNSATPENHHIDVIDKLAHLKDKDIEIICPLSYGDNGYAKKVGVKGKSIFGEKFIPVYEYIDADEYLKLVASCSVGVFNNDRQQAMGNINMLLEMGRKIYLREGTSMRGCFENFGIKTEMVNSLKNATVNEIFSYNKKIAERNREGIIRKNKEYDNNWSIILNI